MIKTVTITNHLGESLALDLKNPENSSGFFVRAIEGLGPPKADINTSKVSSSDGSFFNSSRTNERNILIKLGFLENLTIEDTRQLSYKYFPIKKRIKIEIETDNRTIYTYGYVESNEPDIFSKEEGTDISIICPNSYFAAPADASVQLEGIEPLFEFPFSNESLTEDLIIFGEISAVSELVINYVGDASVGMVIRIHAGTGGASNVRMVNTATGEVMSINSDRLVLLTGSDISDGDDIIISTVEGNLYASLIRSGETYNILNCLALDSDWFKLEKGENSFAITVDYGIANLSFTFDFEILYEGV